jgi:hypothetical protein
MFQRLIPLSPSHLIKHLHNMIFISMAKFNDVMPTLNKGLLYTLLNLQLILASNVIFKTAKCTAYRAIINNLHKTENLF